MSSSRAATFLSVDASERSVLSADTKVRPKCHCTNQCRSHRSVSLILPMNAANEPGQLDEYNFRSSDSRRRQQRSRVGIVAINVPRQPSTHNRKVGERLTNADPIAQILPTKSSVVGRRGFGPTTEVDCRRIEDAAGSPSVLVGPHRGIKFRALETCAMLATKSPTSRSSLVKRLPIVPPQWTGSS